MRKLWLPLAVVLISTGVLLVAKPAADSTIFIGMCDASAAASIDAEHFIIADDEDNTLRIFRRSGGEAIAEKELSEFLGNQTKKKKAKEADLEAAAKIGSRIYWISSHGRNKKGKDSPERERLFATDVAVEDGNITVTPVGQPYDQLLEDLLAAPQLEKYNLKDASEKAPKDDGALNIEGLSGTPDGRLLIGFRNPIRDGKTLVVPLLNPAEVVQGERAKLGDPLELDLGGLGIRSLGWHAGKYVIIAGATGEGGESQLFTWDGKGEAKRVEGISFPALNPEGIAFNKPDGKSEYFLLSDDGGVSIDGKDCKKLKDPKLKRFRGQVVEI